MDLHYWLVSEVVPAIKPELRAEPGAGFTRTFELGGTCAPPTAVGFAVAHASRRYRCQLPAGDLCLTACLRELQFLKAVHDDEFRYLGGWFVHDEADTRTYLLALTAIISDPGAALIQARANAQRFVFDLLAGRDISLAQLAERCGPPEPQPCSRLLAEERRR